MDFQKAVIKICREAEAVRSLLAQIVRQANAYPLAAHDDDITPRQPANWSPLE